MQPLNPLEARRRGHRQTTQMPAAHGLQPLPTPTLALARGRRHHLTGRQQSPRGRSAPAGGDVLVAADGHLALPVSRRSRRLDHGAHNRRRPSVATDTPTVCPGAHTAGRDARGDRSAVCGVSPQGQEAALRPVVFVGRVGRAVSPTAATSTLGGERATVCVPRGHGVVTECVPETGYRYHSLPVERLGNVL